jgi:hypothetical protein
MNIGITERVARLYSNGEFNGSAWLINPTHAITARHCVFSGCLLLERLTLSFPSGPTVKVTVAADNSDLDVAMLEIAAEDLCTPLADRIIQLARRLLSPEMAVGVAGHPGNSLEKLIGAYHINGRVIDIDQPLIGQKKVFVQIGCLSVGGASVEDLKGLSGGPAWSRMNGDGQYAAGILLSVPTLDSIFTVPISALLGWQGTLDDAYAQSPDLPEGPLCLELVGDGIVGWSAVVPPSKSTEMWEGLNRIRSVSCRASRSELGDEMFWALVRLFAHSGIRCYLRGADEWQNAFQSLGLENDTEFNECSESAAKHSLAELAAPVQDLYSSELADIIHQALDRWLWVRIDRRIIGILGGLPSEATDYRIDTALSDRMLQLWQDEWQPILLREPTLLRTLLVRLANHDESAETKGSALARVGKGLEADFRILWEPCLFALALAASGIALTPECLTRGNFTLIPGGAEGHACGSETVRGQRIAMTLRKNFPSWRASLVLLPLMQEGFLTIYKTTQPMKQVTGRPRIGDPGPPPVIVSSESEFLIALEQGPNEVLTYIQGLQNSLSDIISARFGEEEAGKWKQRLVL